MEKNKLYTETIDKKLDLVLQELKNFGEKLSQTNDKINTLNIENQTEHKNTAIALERIDKKIESLESEHSTIFERLDSLDKNIERVDRRITNLKSDNNEEHTKIMELLTSLNSAFIHYETDGLDKIKILFDADDDRKNHQNIYGHEFYRLNDLVAKNSFRISNLEQHQ